MCWKRLSSPVYREGKTMFSGIVAACGVIEQITPLEKGVRLHMVVNGLDLSDVAIGDSIANNGVCLTVVERTQDHVGFDVSAETLACTVGLTNVGAEVNLEKALRLSDRLGGHLVTGHVDGVGTVVHFTPVGESHDLRIRAPEALAPYIARKGSVTVNGVSLTVNAVEGTDFWINLIPHTVAVTNLKTLRPGAGVNLEIDLIARYCERLLSFRREH
jgi:riboflavin synthase